MVDSFRYSGKAAVDLVEQRLLASMKQARWPSAVSAIAAPDEPDHLLQLYDSQCYSRHLDGVARELMAAGHGFYTIGSAGHEANAGVASAFRVSDMAFLHYRSGALMLQRAALAHCPSMITDVLLSLMAAEADPIAAGRHKVWGSVQLHVPPQTSTIASHLPKAVGCALSISRAAALQLSTPLPTDSVVLCSFGDASLNHASALAALNSAEWICRQGLPLPLVLICEDNGLGISVPTPQDWIQSQYANRPYLRYLRADGLNVWSVYQTALAAERIARQQRVPVLLHLPCVRLLGHAGVDDELSYRSSAAIEADIANDPLLHTAAMLVVDLGMAVDDVIARYMAAKQAVADALAALPVPAPRLADVSAVQASIIPPMLESQQIPRVALSFPEALSHKKRWLSQPLTLAQQLNCALTETLLAVPTAIVMGEDVGALGGIYRVTQGLQQQFGPSRVFDTILDETTILGQAIGHAQNGFLPIAEMQFLAYFHNAQDQLRSEAATLPFFSNGQFANPMIVRIASFATSNGVGGHFHNENSLSVLRDIPGLIVACPSDPATAPALWRSCVKLAYQQQRVVVVLEPLALYHQHDLFTRGDGAWLAPWDDTRPEQPVGQCYRYGDSDSDVAVVTYGNGVRMAQQAMRQLAACGIKITVIDLCWLVPLPLDALRRELAEQTRVLIVDECRLSGSLSEGLMCELAMPGRRVQRIAAADSFIPLGPSASELLPTVKDIVDAVKALCAD